MSSFAKLEVPIGAYRAPFITRTFQRNTGGWLAQKGVLLSGPTHTSLTIVSIITWRLLSAKLQSLCQNRLRLRLWQWLSEVIPLNGVAANRSQHRHLIHGCGSAPKVGPRSERGNYL